MNPELGPAIRPLISSKLTNPARRNASVSEGAESRSQFRSIMPETAASNGRTDGQTGAVKVSEGAPTGSIDLLNPKLTDTHEIKS